MLRAVRCGPDAAVAGGVGPAAERQRPAIDDQQLRGKGFEAAGIEHRSPHRQIGGEGSGKRFIIASGRRGDGNARGRRQTGIKARRPATAIGQHRLGPERRNRRWQGDMQLGLPRQQRLGNDDIGPRRQRAIAKADPLLRQQLVDRRTKRL